VTRRLVVLLLVMLVLLSAPAARADSGQVESARNNPIGINLIRWIEPHYLRAAAELVNSNGGDWGYATIVLVDEDRDDPARFQRLLDECALLHLTPIIRIGTRFDLVGGTWSRPDWNDPFYWRDFFGELRWPTTPKYVVVGNEPNLGREWGGEVDPAGYARYLERWVELFAHDPSYRIFNGALDASNDTSLPGRMDEFEFIDAMRGAVPRIFERLHGWASNPYHFWWGKGTRFTYRAYETELEAIGRDMPVIVLEHHPFEIDEPRAIAAYYQEAYAHWLADRRVIAITPFFWNPESNRFWMYRVNGDGSVADESPTYFWLKGLAKTAGSPHFHPPIANAARPRVAPVGVRPSKNPPADAEAMDPARVVAP
jgi:hypothetical protein